MINNKLGALSVLVLLAIAACSDNSNNSNNADIISVSFMNKGAVAPNSVSTKVVLKADSIEFSKIISGQVVEKWVKQAHQADFSPIQNKIIEHDLFGAYDVTLLSGQPSCSGWQGMSIVIEKADSAHTLNIDGSVCSRAQWPAGISELVNLQESIIASVTCITYSPSAPDWCADGAILPPLIDENGCYGPPRCQRNILCPEYSPPAPDWCADGTIIPPQVDQAGCYGPPTCQRNRGRI